MQNIDTREQLMKDIQKYIQDVNKFRDLWFDRHFDQYTPLFYYDWFPENYSYKDFISITRFKNRLEKTDLIDRGEKMLQKLRSFSSRDHDSHNFSELKLQIENIVEFEERYNKAFSTELTMMDSNIIVNTIILAEDYLDDVHKFESRHGFWRTEKDKNGIDVAIFKLVYKFKEVYLLQRGVEINAILTYYIDITHHTDMQQNVNQLEGKIDKIINFYSQYLLDFSEEFPGIDQEKLYQIWCKLTPLYKQCHRIFEQPITRIDFNKDNIAYIWESAKTNEDRYWKSRKLLDSAKEYLNELINIEPSFKIYEKYIPFQGYVEEMEKYIDIMKDIAANVEWWQNEGMPAFDEFQKRPDFLEWTEKYAVSEDDENFDDGPLYPPHPYNRFRR